MPLKTVLSALAILSVCLSGEAAFGGSLAAKQTPWERSAPAARLATVAAYHRHIKPLRYRSSAATSLDPGYHRRGMAGYR
jgi:hypothetical protein